MKNLILIAILVLSITEVKAQKLKTKDVPETVKNAFKISFPLIKRTIWCKEGNTYEVSFRINKNDKFIIYDNSGSRIELEVEVSDFALPVPAIEFVTKKFGKSKIKESSRIVNANGNVTYEIELKGWELIFDSKGNLIRSFKNPSCALTTKPLAFINQIQ